MITASKPQGIIALIIVKVCVHRAVIVHELYSAKSFFLRYNATYISRFLQIIFFHDDHDFYSLITSTMN